MRRTVVLILSLALTTSQAAAFSGPGHQGIADVAQDRLSPATRKALGRILQDSDDLAPGALAAVATWPDEVRARAAHGNVAPGWTSDDVQEADDFNRDHPRNGEWHFVNLPLGAAGASSPTPAAAPAPSGDGGSRNVRSLRDALYP